MYRTLHSSFKTVAAQCRVHMYVYSILNRTKLTILLVPEVKLSRISTITSLVLQIRVHLDLSSFIKYCISPKLQKVFDIKSHFDNS